MSTVKFYREDENKVVVEDGDYSTSIFSNQYDKALKTFVSLVKRQMRNREQDKDVPPAILAFCGDRGEGKSSCLETCSHIIKERAANDNYLSKVLGYDKEVLDQNRFYFLKTIDPAFFDEGHNALELILGQMFTEFQKIICGDVNKDTQEADKLREAFHYAKVCLTQLYKSSQVIYDPLEELGALSAGLQLKEKMRELVDNYLNFLDNKDSDKFLVISIDDIDLNIAEAYTMVEHIRKYLALPNCILLLSLNVDQLIEVIGNSMRSKENEGTSFGIRDMATKYVTKLIPLEQRVVMPKIYDICNQPLELYQSHEPDEKPLSYPTIKEGLLHVVYDKTRYLLYNNNGGVSPLVPNNLRSLRHLLGLLLSMDDFDEGTEALANKTAFKAYFFQTWTKQLNASNQKFAERISKDPDPTSVNKIVVSHLISLKGIEQQVDDIIKLIVNPQNYSYNVSLGDVLYFVDYLERSNTDEELALLLFFIKAYYSIRLYDYYDEITSNKDDVYPKAKTEGAKGGEIFKHEAWFQGTNILQRFVCGSMFTYMPGKLLPIKERGSSNVSFRDMKVYRGKAKLYADNASKILRQIDQYEAITEENEKNEFAKRFRAMEFFALTTKESIRQKDIKNVRIKETDDTTNYKGDIDRTASRPYHLSKYNEQTGYHVFDILAPFTNMLNIRYAYDRFAYMSNKDHSFFDFAKTHNWSLLNKMVEKVKIKEEKENEGNAKNMAEVKGYYESDKCYWRLLSNATIRNADVQSAVMEAIRSRRNSFGGEKEVNFITRFYREIINSEMSTYSDTKTGTHYTIRFVFLEALIDELSQNSYIQEILSESLKVVNGESKPVENYYSIVFKDNWQKKKAQLMKNILDNSYHEQFVSLTENTWNQHFNAEYSYSRETYISFLTDNYYLMTGNIIESNSDDNEE